MLTYRQQVWVDVGVATVLALSGRPRPDALSEVDLLGVVQRLAALYTQPGPMQKHMRGLVFFNSGYTASPNPARQAEHVRRVLLAWQQPGSLGERCAFCGDEAAYRASREEVPLLNGRDIYNFGAAGQAGLPICGWCSLAVQALPLGCLKTGGGLLAVHSPDHGVLQGLVAGIVARNLAELSLGELSNLPYVGTRLMELALDWAHEGAPLLGYHFSNYGSGARVQVFSVPSHLLAFFAKVRQHPQAGLTAAWEWAVQSAWQDQRNGLYEDLLQARSTAVLRRWLLPTHHWGLIALFLRSLTEMPPEKIALLRQLGERFAAYAAHKRAFRFQFSRTDEYSTWRRYVMRASEDALRVAGRPLVSFEEFLMAFTAPPGEVNDWRLARDLVYLAMLEALGPADLEDSEEETEGENNA